MKQWWFLHNGLVFAHYLPLSIWCSNMIMPILGTQASVPLIQKEDVVSKLNSSWNEWGKPKPGAEWKSKFGKLKKGEGGLCSRCVYPGSPYMWVSSKKKHCLFYWSSIHMHPCMHEFSSVQCMPNSCAFHTTSWSCIRSSSDASYTHAPWISRAFIHMPKKGVISVNALISGYVQKW